jgi:hypothetical protein
MSAHDEGPGLNPPRAPANLEADTDDSDGAADQTREYRPVSGAELDEAADRTREHRPAGVGLTAQRLAMKQQLSELARLANLAPSKPPEEPIRPPVTAPPATAPSSRPIAPRLMAGPPASSMPPDRTLQLAPIAPAFAETVVFPARRLLPRIRWAAVLIVLAVALPGGLLLWPAPATMAPAASATEPVTPTPSPGPGSSAHVAKELATPQVNGNAAGTTHRVRAGSAPKPAASDPESNQR